VVQGVDEALQPDGAPEADLAGLPLRRPARRGRPAIVLRTQPWPSSSRRTSLTFRPPELRDQRLRWYLGDRSWNVDRSAVLRKGRLWGRSRLPLRRAARGTLPGPLSRGT